MNVTLAESEWGQLTSARHSNVLTHVGHGGNNGLTVITRKVSTVLRGFSAAYLRTYEHASRPRRRLFSFHSRANHLAASGKSSYVSSFLPFNRRYCYFPLFPERWMIKFEERHLVTKKSIIFESRLREILIIIRRFHRNFNNSFPENISNLYMIRYQ